MTTSIRSYGLQAIALCLGLFHIYTGLFGSFDASIQRGVHLALAVAFFAVHSTRDDALWFNRFNLLFGIAVIATIGWRMSEHIYLSSERFEFVSPLTSLEIILGSIFVVSVLELCRRAIGWVLPALVLVLFVYCFIPGLPGLLRHSGYSLGLLLDVQYLTYAGAFGIPLSVSASYIGLFIIFGAFMERSGLGALIIDLANHAVGHYRGGPAKVAVVASAFTGTISGSAPANVMTTGALTIPLMKKTGYPAHWAGAIEAAASTGGILMPPIMGAIAFLMAQYTGIPYLTIATIALVPALFYFLGIFLAVHWAAIRHNVIPVPRAPGSSAWAILKARGHLILPVVILIALLVEGFSPQYAVSYAILAVIVLSWLKPTTAMRFRDIRDALVNAAAAIAFVALTTAVAGMVVGVFEMTGLSLSFAQEANSYVVGLFSGLVLTMIVSIVLGMGVPPSVSYIVQIAVTIPIVIGFLKTSGVDPATAMLIAHFFVMYYASLAVLTPPDALASIAAAGLAKAPVMKTALYATRVAFVAFIVPFLFAYKPTLLLQGLPLDIALDIGFAAVAVVAGSIALEGYRIPWFRSIDRLIGVLVAVGCAYPDHTINIFATILGMVWGARIFTRYQRHRVAIEAVM